MELGVDGSYILGFVFGYIVAYVTFWPFERRKGDANGRTDTQGNGGNKQVLPGN
jgi:hypothetical protein